MSLSRVYAQVVELRSALKALNDVLLSIAKLQNLKAIHNDALKILADIAVVINHKTTKFENNSQPYTHIKSEAQSCYQSQNYKI